MLAMIEFFVICGLTALANWLVKKAMRKKILESETAKQSVRIRKKYKWIRLTIKIFFSIFFVVELILIIAFIINNNLPSGVAYLIIPPLVFVAMMVIVDASMPVSGLTIDDIKEEDFSLYLRGFSTDSNNNFAADAVVNAYNNRFGGEREEESEEIRISYVDSWGIRSPDITIEKPFTEYSFIMAFSGFSKMPVYSVGMPKELESPQGSKRIFLDNATWQSDVARLIEKAKNIFVLVNPSNSCAWEILRCQEHALEKTYFLIHNVEDLRGLCEKLQDKTPECLRTCLDKGDKINHSIAFVDNGQNKVFYYTNTQEGFKEMFELVSKHHLNV